MRHILPEAQREGGRLPLGSRGRAAQAHGSLVDGLDGGGGRARRRATQIKPDFAEAYNNLAVALLTVGDNRGGLAAIQTALRIKPDLALAHLNRAVTWLRMGQFEPGWHEFEWRRLCENYRIAPLPAPLWDGSPQHGRSVLLHAEQGLGDTIQLIRYAPLVKRRCGTVILQCQRGLVPLLSRCPGVDRLLVQGESLPEYHVQAPLMSLPLILGTTLGTIPGGVPYVFADPALAEAWRGRLAGLQGFKVGVSWQGNPKYSADHLRSIPLARFVPLARLPGVTLLSLQVVGHRGRASRLRGAAGFRPALRRTGPLRLPDQRPSRGLEAPPERGSTIGHCRREVLRRTRVSHLPAARAHKTSCDCGDGWKAVPLRNLPQNSTTHGASRPRCSSTGARRRPWPW
ncbi:MAG: hypothetical protein ABSG86_19515 [Thermoguttaceae bacterium]